MNAGTAVHVIRHGRTALNAQGRFRGLEDVPLDERGLAEAEAVARTLASRPIVAVAHSPLTRARQTAEPLSRRLGLVPEPDPRLIDLDLGVWTGLTAGEAAAIDPAAYRRYRVDPRSATPPEGEPLSEAERRIVHAVDFLGERWRGAEVAVVSHELPIRLLLSGLMGLDRARVWDIPLATGSVAALSGSPGSWRVVEEPRAP